MGNYLAIPLTHAVIAIPNPNPNKCTSSTIFPPPSSSSSWTHVSICAAAENDHDYEFVAPSSPNCSTSHGHPSPSPSTFSSLFSLGPPLGSASPTSVVRLCTSLSTSLPYACKTFFKHCLRTPRQLQSVRREILISRKLSCSNTTATTPASGSAMHRCFVQFHHVFEDADNIHLVMELCHGGSVYQRMLKRAIAIGDGRHQPLFAEAEAAAIMKGLLESLEACHDEGIIHRDVKLRNILFVGESEDDFRVKLADFGLSIMTEKETGRARGYAGTPAYMAPEVLEGVEYGEEVDLWSAGVVLHILLSGKLPFMVRRTNGGKKTMGKVRVAAMAEEEEVRLSLEDPDWSRVSVRGKDMVRGLLRRDPKQRMTASEALEHPWIRQHLGYSGRRRTTPSTTTSSMYTTSDGWLPLLSSSSSS